MNCPQCNGNLLERRVSGIDVDACSTCGGVWFDAGELDAYRSSVGIVSGDSAPIGHAFQPVAGGEPWSCPRCATESVRAGAVGHYLLHRCSACFGVYVSRTELETLSKSPKRRYAEGAANAASEAAWYAPDLLIEGALELLAGIVDGL
jgi:Zn-finger nucleic acid-binding protein